jgi:predicted aminopeptidase
MPLEPFDLICHDISLAEMRVCEAPGLASLGLPIKYFLREFYCTESDCDCRRVLVQFMPDDNLAQVAASINYGWGKAKFYKKWSHDPELWREMAGATLEAFAEQGPHADKFLLIFNKIIADHAIVAAFRRHYKLVKEITDVPPASRREPWDLPL